jgi:hypothetical protein
MAAALWAILLTAAFPAPPDEVVSGTWWVKGHETFGNLIIRVDADGRVSGTIYEQPIEGTFDAETKRLSFKRLRDVLDKKGVQVWTGELTHVEGSRPPSFTLQGTFTSTAGDEFGQPGVAYRWTSTEIRHPPPSVDLKELQGEWEVASVTRCLRETVKLPDNTGLNEIAAQVQIRENQLLFQGKVAGTLANDLALASVDREIGFPGYRPICLTLPDGKGLMCSYQVKSDGVEIAYPHTTSCHRGSGHVVMLKRPKWLLAGEAASHCAQHERHEHASCHCRARPDNEAHLACARFLARPQRERRIPTCLSV